MRADFGDAVVNRALESDKFGGPSEWKIAEPISETFCHTDEPLSLTQATQLVQAFSGAKTTTRTANIGWNDFDWDRVVSQAGSFLAAPQLQVLRAMAAQRRGAAQIAAAVLPEISHQ